MDLASSVLMFGLLFFGLAALAWVGSKAVLKQKVKFAEAAMAGLMMVLLGSLAAVVLPVLYGAVRPRGSAMAEKRYELLGSSVELDIALVMMLGLAVGYGVALNMTAGGRWSRRLLLAVFAAVVTPGLLMGAEYVVEMGSTALGSSVVAAAPQAP
jgi:hypothetical protein